ncbi:MAG: isoprenoid biosynthesis glyoxalase ElbB [Spirochaetia bacterium]|nr:isoprenoid biosynthesis glyoxalase ElbB [Spirochaetia bacterium]
MKKIAVLLSGCGVYDGSEIHESVFTLLALAKRDLETFCMAPDTEQHHVIDHTKGEEMPEKRNVLKEAARIARGDIRPLSEITADDFDGLVIPGGFGAAKNLTKWAFSGPDGEIDFDVKRVILQTKEANKPIAAMCMAPVVLAKAFAGSDTSAVLTVGTTEAKSPYDIAAISQGMESLGAKAKMAGVEEAIVDAENKIVTTPCYMMDAPITAVRNGIEKAIAQFEKFL